MDLQHFAAMLIFIRSYFRFLLQRWLCFICCKARPAKLNMIQRHIRQEKQ